MNVSNDDLSRLHQEVSDDLRSVFGANLVDHTLLHQLLMLQTCYLKAMSEQLHDIHYAIEKIYENGAGPSER